MLKRAAPEYEEAIAVINDHLSKQLSLPAMYMSADVCQNELVQPPLTLARMVEEWKSRESLDTRAKLGIDMFEPTFLSRAEGGIDFEVQTGDFPTPFYTLKQLADSFRASGLEPDQAVIANPKEHCHIRVQGLSNPRAQYEKRETEPLPVYFQMKAYATPPKALMIFLVHLLESKFKCIIVRKHGFPEDSDPVWYHWQALCGGKLYDPFQRGVANKRLHTPTNEGESTLASRRDAEILSYQQVQDAQKAIRKFYKKELHGPATQEIRMQFLNRYDSRTHSFELEPLSLQDIIDAWNSDVFQDVKRTLGIERLEASPLRRVEGGIHFEYKGSDGPFPNPYYRKDDLDEQNDELRTNPIAFCNIRLVEHGMDMRGKENALLPPYFVFRSKPGLPRAMMVFLDILLSRLGCQFLHATNYYDQSHPIWNIFYKEYVRDDV